MATLEGGGGNETTLNGSDSENDSIWGAAGNDTLRGGPTTGTGGGNDFLDGGTGSDRIYGGDGDDTLIGGSGNTADSLYGGNGTDTADYSRYLTDLVPSPVFATNTIAVNVNLATGTASGLGSDVLAGIENVIGGSGNDTITGDGNANVLVGGAGNDVLDGGAGHDLLVGGDGNDSLVGGTGDDTLRGGAGADTLVGGQGLDFVDYSDSTAAVSVNLANSAFSGGYATGDTGTGVDGIIGSNFNDTLIGFDGSSPDPADAYTNVIYGGGGDDSISGLGGSDSLYGGDGNDTVQGDDEHDLVTGDAGNDRLLGGGGNDTIYGGTGQDTIYGGAGQDFAYGGDDRDHIHVNGGDVVPGESVDGGGDNGETDQDTLTVDITGFGWARFDINYDPLNHENGTMIFYGPDGTTVVGTLDFTEIEHVVIICFTPGTQILTDRGAVTVETLAPGDLVMTRDNGLQPLRWVGTRKLSYAELLARPQLQPVRIGAGALAGAGPERSMLVSPQHRVLVEGARAEMYFGESEVLVPAKHLTGLAEVTRALPAEGVTYVHILFDRHEIVQSDGIWTESFQPAERTLNALDAAARAEVLELFPELVNDATGFPTARLSLKAHEAKVLVSG